MRLIIPIIIAFCIIPAIVFAATWFDDYGTTRKITLQTTSGDLTDFVYVLNYSDFVDTAGFIGDGDMLANCKDIRITDDDNSTLLKWEFEDYDDSFGCNQNNTLIWVKAPNLFANNSSVSWFYYNNSSETTFGNETNNTWSDYILVNHFSYETVANWSNGSTANMFDFQIFGNGTITNASFGDGILCDGGATSIANTSSQTVLNGLGDKNFTIEFWINAETASSGDDWFFNKWVGGDKTFLFLYTGNKIRFIGWDGATEHDFRSEVISPDTWYYFAIVQNSTHFLMYRDGVLVNTTAFSGTLQNNTASVSVCAQPAGAANFNGFLDEIRIHDTDLSADYFKRTYENSIDQMAGLGEAISMAAPPPKSLEDIWGFSDLALWLMIFIMLLATIGVLLKAV